MSPKLRAFLGEKWTLNGHEPYCSCDGCWTDRRLMQHPSATDQRFRMSIYREWWELPLWFVFWIIVGVVIVLVWG